MKREIPKTLRDGCSKRNPRVGTPVQTYKYIDVKGVERRYDEPHTYDLSFYRFDTENALIASKGTASGTGIRNSYSYTLFASTYEEYVAKGSPIVRTPDSTDTVLTKDESDSYSTNYAYLSNPRRVYYVTDEHRSPSFDISKMNQPLGYTRVDVSETGEVTEGNVLITYYYTPSKYVEVILPIPIVTELPK